MKHCPCGKVLSFNSKEEADNWVKDPRSSIAIVRSYECDKTRGVWHVTSKIAPLPKPGKKLKLLEEELHAMSTMKEKISSFLREDYKKNGTYKYSASDLYTELARKSPNISRSTVSATLTFMRKDGSVTQLERIPNAPGGASYFALTEILDEVTNPKKPENKGGEKMSKPETTVKVPEQTTTPKPSTVNPFDKVNSTLGDILTKVNGLANGYAAISEALSRGRTNEIAQVLTAIEEVKRLTSAPVAADFDVLKVADAINKRLIDFHKEDSLIYRVRDEIDARVGRLEELSLNEWEKILASIKVPTDFFAMTDEEKYKQGIKDGIKLAVEMGLILPDA